MGVNMTNVTVTDHGRLQLRKRLEAVCTELTEGGLQEFVTTAERLATDVGFSEYFFPMLTVPGNRVREGMGVKILLHPDWFAGVPCAEEPFGFTKS